MALVLVHFCIAEGDTLPTNAEAVNVGVDCDYAIGSLTACVGEDGKFYVTIPDCDDPILVCWDATENSLVAQIPDDCCESDCCSGCPTDCGEDYGFQIHNDNYTPVSDAVAVCLDDRPDGYIYYQVLGGICSNILMGSYTQWTLTCAPDTHCWWLAIVLGNGTPCPVSDFLGIWPCGTDNKPAEGDVTIVNTLSPYNSEVFTGTRI